ncbi:Glu-tRNA(Gln) amidotransferase subunit GatD [Candidatus Bathyarchaeota archaeon]|nr:Glu-tRNA(Gln) amidotransferase subunit GatD [Candidatus Bathyarchaeota archaeon]
MTEEKEFSGYKGEALAIIKNAGAKIGDIVQITRNGHLYEGILIPSSEYGNNKHLVIKLSSGYNIGVKITSDTNVKKIKKGARPAFLAPSLPEQNPALPKVSIISTGGTIASRVDYRTGAVRPALTASDLYSVVPELTDIAQIDTHILFSIFSENVTPKHWTKMAKAITSQITNGMDGVVIAHGTDTMGYTAAALSFAIQDLPVPIILVGSQRSADRPSSDAATNLIGAVRAAATAPFAEVGLAMHETTSDTSILIHKGTKVRKCHTSKRDAFESVNAAPLARVQGQTVTMLETEYQKRDSTRKPTLRPLFNKKVGLVKFYPGMKPTMINWYTENNYLGIIIEGTGLGHVDSRLFKALENAVEQHLVVGMTSQCIWGRINMNVYNQGRDLLSLGVVPLEDMLPETAVVKLMWIFGQTKDADKAREMLTEDIEGELSPRTVHLDERGV